MKKIYYLSTCSTCKRLISNWNPGSEVEMIDIKSRPLTESEVDHMAALAGGYEALFSRRAMKFRGWGLHEKELSEKDYREYLLKEYTFLKRPVVLVGDQIFVGNSAKTALAAHHALSA